MRRILVKANISKEPKGSSNWMSKAKTGRGKAGLESGSETEGKVREKKEQRKYGKCLGGLSFSWFLKIGNTSAWHRYLLRASIAGHCPNQGSYCCDKMLQERAIWEESGLILFIFSYHSLSLKATKVRTQTGMESRVQS